MEEDFVNGNPPKDDRVQVKWVLNDAGSRNSQTENVLQGGKVISCGDAINVVQVATKMLIR